MEPANKKSTFRRTFRRMYEINLQITIMENTKKLAEGIIAINKPSGMTSHDVVAKVRKISGIKKVGHAGTLDPLAAGVLVVGIGREATKKLGKIVEKEKEYIANIRLGIDSSTDDEEGEKKKYNVAHKPTRQEIKKAIGQFIGEIQQLPPRYSAVKIRGKRAYQRARDGEQFPLPLRSVEIKDISIMKFNWPYLKLKVTTGSGVYVRSLARDIGHDLGTGGYLAGLERTRVGTFVIKKSYTIES